MQLPVAQGEAGVALGGLGQAPARAGDALVVQQLAALQVGDGGVGKDQLAWAKISWRAAKRLVLCAATSTRERKKVIWKP